MKVSFLIVLMLISVGCAGPALIGLKVAAGVTPCTPNSKEQDRIVGGEKVAYGDPDQNLVTMLRIRRRSQEAVCTGALISDRVVLTAAHCIDGVSVADVDVVFTTGVGCLVDQHKKLSVPIHRIVIHKNFDGTPKSLSDVGLVLLDQEAPADQQRLDIIKPADRPTADRVLFVGYGITEETKKDSQILRRVYKSYKNHLNFRERSIVVDQRDRAGFCRGDSGAPLIGEVFGEPVILGVNSANVGVGKNTECHELSLAMDALFFSDWIIGNRRALDDLTWFGRQFSSSIQRL